MPSTYRGQKRALDSLKLELQMFGSHHVGAGTEPIVSGFLTSKLSLQISLVYF